MYGRRHHPRHSRVHPRGARHHRSRGRGGPRARRGDIRAAMLALLAERPMHGYEMIKQVEERTGGAWRPSAGSIYPTLQLLEDEGLIRGEEAEGKRRFALTDEGRAEQESRAGERTPWEQVTAGAPPETVRLGHAARQLTTAVGQSLHAADEEQRRQIRELLDETRRRLYGILADGG